MSPKSKEQFEIIRTQSRETIMEAALELFAHYGFHNTSISQIAKEAGISKGLLYNYFDSKEDLLKRIVFEAIAVGEDIMEAEVISQQNPKVQLRNIIESSFTMVQVNLHYWKLITALSFQTEVLEGFEEIINVKTETVLAQVEEIFQHLGYEDFKNEALMFGSIIDGSLLHFMHRGESYPIDEMKAFIIKKYCS
jgi:AcrR family transcriptional regulator